MRIVLGLLSLLLVAPAVGAAIDATPRDSWGPVFVAVLLLVNAWVHFKRADVFALASLWIEAKKRRLKREIERASG